MSETHEQTDGRTDARGRHSCEPNERASERQKPELSSSDANRTINHLACNARMRCGSQHNNLLLHARPLRWIQLLIQLEWPFQQSINLISLSARARAERDVCRRTSVFVVVGVVAAAAVAGR